MFGSMMFSLDSDSFSLLISSYSLSFGFFLGLNSESLLLSFVLLPRSFLFFVSMSLGFLPSCLKLSLLPESLLFSLSLVPHSFELFLLL
jgi:hypothetical protein